MKFFQTIKFKLGYVGIIADSEGVNRIIFSESVEEVQVKNSITQMCVEQLQAYFNRRLKEFSCPLSITGTEFQISVWNATKKIPFGTVKSYSQLAREINKPSAYRAVANALGQNPVPILIPCHRVIRSNGDIGGFSSGIKLKKFLLQLEGVTI